MTNSVCYSFLLKIFHASKLPGIFSFSKKYIYGILLEAAGFLKRQLILAEMMIFFFSQDKCSCMRFHIINELSEPKECHFNIYLSCSDRLEFAPPGYFSQTAKADKQRGATEPSAPRRGLNPQCHSTPCFTFHIAQINTIQILV